MDSHVREVDSMVTQEERTMKPIVLFGIQFTLSLVAYWLIAFWYVAPRLSELPPELALAPLLWVHAFRIVGGTILAPGAVGPGVPMEFRTMIGYGDLITARHCCIEPKCASEASNVEALLHGRAPRKGRTTRPCP
jgi:hypothetical protein